MGRGFLSQSSSIYTDQSLSRDAVLWAGCDQVLRSAAELARYLPEPSSITRDLCPLLCPTSQHTGVSLPLSHRDSRDQPSTRAELQLPQFLEMLTPSCDGSFILCGLCLGQSLLHIGQGFVSLSPSQESCLCLVRGPFIPW